MNLGLWGSPPAPTDERGITTCAACGRYTPLGSLLSGALCGHLAAGAVPSPRGAQSHTCSGGRCRARTSGEPGLVAHPSCTVPAPREALPL